MTTVAFVFTTPPSELVVDAIGLIQAGDATVVVVGPEVRGWHRVKARADGWETIRNRAAPVPIDRDNPPRRWGREWSWVVTRNLWRKGTYRPLKLVFSAPTIWWRMLAHNPAAMAALRDADVYAALDGGAVYSVWRLARANRRAAAINGLAPALEYLGLAG